MADDSLNLEVVLSARTQGLQGAEKDLSLIQDTMDSLGRSGQILPKTLDQVSSGLLKIGSAAASSSKNTLSQTTAFQKMQAEVQKTSSALRELAEEYVTAGGRDPLDFASRSGTVGIDEARQILAVREAEGVSAERVAQQVIAAEDRKTDAVRDSVKTEEILREARRSQELSGLRSAIQERGRLEEQASQKARSLAGAENTVSESRRKQELSELRASIQERHKLLQAAAKEEARIASVQGGRDYGNLSVNIDAGIEARQKEARAWSDVVKARMNGAVAADRQAEATQRSTAAIGQQTSNLPRLRYALYDVSNQLFVIGGALTAFSVLSFKAAIDYERAFANVIRTNDQLMNSQVSANRMFQEFLDLAGEIPTSFGDLSQIGQLAGQLDVPTNALRSFTESVAMFSATTGESIDTTATAFGRLDALLPGVEGNFQALGSSILNVGINSVATEGEIIKITTQLAGIGSQAGLTYDELVGLSGALASVGIQPELARGTITRLFGQISRSVATGGERLEEFGKIAGTTGDNFASTWGSAPMEAVVDLLQGLNLRGAEAEASLRAIGITSVRDVPAILRLAQTVDSVLVPALGDAATGADEATQLADNYGVIAETVASKLQILSNNFQSLIAVAGDSNGVFGAAIDILNNFLTVTRKVLENPVAGFFAQSAVAVTALSGVVFVLLAGVTRAHAGILAFKTAMAEAGVQATGLRAQLLGLVGGLSGVNAASVKASGSMGRLTTMMRGAGIASAALIAIPVAMWFRDWVAELNNAVVDTDTLLASISRLDTGISSKISEDVQGVLNQSIESLGASTQTAANSAFIPIVGAYVESIRKASYEAETEFDLGLERLGMKATSFWTTDILTGQPTFLAGFFDSSYAELDKFQEAWIQAWEAASSETQKQAIIDSLSELEDQVVAAGGSSEDFRYNFADLFDVIGSGVNQSALLKEEVSALDGEFEALQGTLLQIVDDVFSAVNAQAALSGALGALGEDYINLGASAAFSGDSMQSSIKAIVEQSGTAGAAASNLQVLYDFILANSSATVSELMYLAQAIASLNDQAGGKKSAPTLGLPDFNAFAKSAERARASFTRAGSAGGGAGRQIAKAAKEARVEIRTLLDYASDLSKQFGRAFSFRFGAQGDLDKITSTFLSIREAAAEASKRIRDLNNDIRGLTSDIDIQEYFLSIAIEYGDTKRAAAIEADLAKKRAELADKSADLQKEQNDLNKSLTGSTQGAIDNRKEITGLLSTYQEYLKSLAESGVSQGNLAAISENLRQDFMRQATALGFSAEELRMYELVFSDTARIIAATPFNVTTDLSGLDAATIAIREFADEANKALSTIGTDSGVGGGGGGGGGGIGDNVVDSLDDALPAVQARGYAMDEKLRQGFLLANPLRSREFSGAIYDSLISGDMSVKEASDKLGLSGESEFLNAYGRFLPADLQKTVPGGMLKSLPQARNAGTSLGQTGASGTNAGFDSNVNLAGGLNRAGVNGAWAAASAGGSLGSAIANGLGPAISLTLNGLLGYGKARKFVRDLTGFQSGGFTGRGGAGEVAGVVHKGEYVLRQDQVNQATGMPNSDALGRLMSGVPSQSTAPAASSSNSGGATTVALTAGTIQAIAQATGKNIFLNGKLIADSSAESYSRDNSVGAF